MTVKPPLVYVIGSLRNAQVLIISAELRKAGFRVFDDWYAGGPAADDAWRDYERQRGHGLKEALGGLAAEHVFNFDLLHLQRCAIGVLVLPAGKSGHLELGWLAGRGKRTYILLDNPARWDIMYKLATGVSDNIDEMVGMVVKDTEREHGV